MSELIVAIGSENDDFDGEIYRYLLELLLRRPIGRWRTEMSFTGHRAVYKLAGVYLNKAQEQGIRHALFAVDNDGGSKRRPEHDESCDPSPVKIDDDDRCRICWLRSAMPATWAQGGARLCLVVPVQTIETWLLWLRGDVLPSPTPEQYHSRPDLKKRFFGRLKPPAAERIALAMEQLRQPAAIDRLRERRSFRHFEVQLSAWLPQVQVKDLG